MTTVVDTSPFLAADADLLLMNKNLLAIAKPAGVLSHPNNKGPAETSAFLGSYDQKRRVFRKGGEELFLVHRLDKEASGVLLAARSEEVRDALVDLFTKGEVKKRYQALLLRAPGRREGRWADHLALGKRGGGAHARVISGRPINSLAHYRVLRGVGGAGYALVEIDLVTGRTHQIRVQAADRRVPVLGDRSYGDFEANKEVRRKLGLRRLFLHAQKMSFKEPVSGRQISLEAPLPPELESCLEAGTSQRSRRRSKRPRKK